jgi:hypothetical protein
MNINSFSNINDVWAADPIKEITDKIKHVNNNSITVNNDKPVEDQSAKLTDSLEKNDPFFSPFASVSLNDKSESHVLSDTFSDFDISNSDIKISSENKKSIRECKSTVKHIKSCSRCNNKLKKMINKRVSDKYDDLIFNYQKKQNHKKYKPIKSGFMSTSTSELLLMIVGVIVILILVIVIIKILNK